MKSLERRMAALFVVGLLCYYSPILGLFDRPRFLGNTPLFHLYLFLSWAVLILVCWLLSRRGER